MSRGRAKCMLDIGLGETDFFNFLFSRRVLCARYWAVWGFQVSRIFLFSGSSEKHCVIRLQADVTEVLQGDLTQWRGWGRVRMGDPRGHSIRGW